VPAVFPGAKHSVFSALCRRTGWPPVSPPPPPVSHRLGACGYRAPSLCVGRRLATTVGCLAAAPPSPPPLCTGCVMRTPWCAKPPPPPHPPPLPSPVVAAAALRDDGPKLCAAPACPSDCVGPTGRGSRGVVPRGGHLPAARVRGVAAPLPSLRGSGTVQRPGVFAPGRPRSSANIQARGGARAPRQPGQGCRRPRSRCGGRRRRRANACGSDAGACGGGPVGGGGRRRR
jgi:hypothetical protein